VPSPGFTRPDADVNTTDTAELAETSTGVVTCTVLFDVLHVGATLTAVPLTVTLFAAIVDGTVVPLGNVTVIVCVPVVRAPPAPVENATVYSAAVFSVVGLGVTVPAVTVLASIVYTFDAAELLFVAATVIVFELPAVVGFLMPAAVDNVTSITDETAIPAATRMYTIRLPASVVVPLVACSSTVDPSSVTVTALVSIVAGTTVPLGNVNVSVSPATSAVTPPSVKLIVYSPTVFTVAGLGVTVAEDTVADVAIV